MHCLPCRAGRLDRGTLRLRNCARQTLPRRATNKHSSPDWIWQSASTGSAASSQVQGWSGVSFHVPAFEFVDRADDAAPDTSDAAGGQTALPKLLATCQRFAEPPVPIPRAPFALSAGLGSANVRAIQKGDLDLVRALVGSRSTCSLVDRICCAARDPTLYGERDVAVAFALAPRMSTSAP